MSIKINNKIKKNAREIEKSVVSSISDLVEIIKNDPENQLDAAKVLVDLGSHISFEIEILYFLRSKKVIQNVALKSRFFPTVFDFKLPCNFDVKQSMNTSPSDRLIISLKHYWDSKSRLRITTKTEFDFLRLCIEGFVQAIENPKNTWDDAKEISKTCGNEWIYAKSSLIFLGAVEVDSDTRKLLLSAENAKNYLIWAREFVDWYKNIHPWPFKDKKGRDRMLESTESIANPIHNLAYDRLLQRNNKQTKEKSPWNALRATVRERLKNAFKEYSDPDPKF